jgi:hypothetical protein
MAVESTDQKGQFKMTTIFETELNSSTDIESLLWRDLELSQQIESILPERSRINAQLRDFPSSDVDAVADAVCARLEEMPWLAALAEFRASRNTNA